MVLKKYSISPINIASQNDQDEGLMLKLFLDTLIKFAQDKPDSLTPYTQQIADDMDELLVGVTVDED